MAYRYPIMNRKETNQLLALFKLAYPTAYRDISEKTKVATVNMWHATFDTVPYSLMERAFDGYRMEHKYPPTVAEMVEALEKLHGEAERIWHIQRMLGNRQRMQQMDAIMACIKPYLQGGSKRSMLASMPSALGGEVCGTSGNYLDRADGVPVLDAGR